MMLLIQTKGILTERRGLPGTDSDGASIGA